MKTADLRHFARALLATPPARTAPTIAEQVDRLGEIKATQADLQAEFDRIRATLEDAGLSEIDGNAYRVTFSTSTRTSTDWKTIAERFKPSPQLIRRHTTTSEPNTACRVTARKTH